jgi:hypothetical protein
VQHPDLNVVSYLRVVEDVLMCRAMIGESCT